ncbi:hypothetical protein TELCIR_03010 [Teladorsagia circumcincta]|uniref:DALR anticodon binding domain-containing protein n=1 Tax=Teladorsagia circumcincta TaxID=45464 RepID=A0A2G9UXW2_TELCI|nr:hypothetical protein TELCIR_03010 [Teladorsagia circumcincta]
MVVHVHATLKLKLRSKAVIFDLVEALDFSYSSSLSAGETVVHFNRLVLCEVTANVMSNCFKILGIREVPRM